jgi:RNAse (barnase) inhibitor barstar
MPWDDTNNIPNLDTYYKSIHYFFKLVKQYNQQFQLLTWDIVNKKCNTISDTDQLPKTHKELSSYL